MARGQNSYDRYDRGMLHNLRSECLAKLGESTTPRSTPESANTSRSLSQGADEKINFVHAAVDLRQRSGEFLILGIDLVEGGHGCGKKRSDKILLFLAKSIKTFAVIGVVD